MSAELIFIYDSHCPWSYASTELVSAVEKELPNITIQLMHCGYFDGDNKVDKKSIDAVKELSNVTFSDNYLSLLADTKDSTIAANIMAWAQNKSSDSAFKLLKALQQAHFIDGNPLESAQDLEPIIAKLKLSPPAKCLKSENFSKDAEHSIHDVYELQDIIGTSAIPAFLLINNDDLILLNHSVYLENPAMFVEAINNELASTS
ncbi:hypothetical protein [Thalassotalea atypica]|uniref:hypothetical protein n=1 Tax=Thalassotalea atypica TaxID=2054316 RepID=UPI00257385EF|nr:hypothetical protein [Thalassotalea atypica]